MAHKNADKQYKDRQFDAAVYDEKYFEGGRESSGYDSYENARKIVTDQFQIIHDVMFPRITADGEAGISVDVACAYGFGVKKLKQLGWIACGGDISEYAIKRGLELNPGLEIAVSDARNESFWKGFMKYQSVDLVTAIEFFEHVDGDDIDKIIGFMKESARWGVFCINASTQPNQDAPAEDADPDHGHLNHYSMAWWITKFAEVGQIDFEAMYELSKRSEAYAPDVHWHNRWLVVRFADKVYEEDDNGTEETE